MLTAVCVTRTLAATSGCTREKEGQIKREETEDSTGRTQVNEKNTITMFSHL